MHHVFVGKVRVGEDDLVDAFLADDVLELVLGPDADAFGIQRAGQRRRIDAAGDARYLRRGEGDDVRVRVAPVHDVEVVEIPSSGTHDYDAPHRPFLAPMTGR